MSFSVTPRRPVEASATTEGEVFGRTQSITDMLGQYYYPAVALGYGAMGTMSTNSYRGWSETAIGYRASASIEYGFGNTSVGALALSANRNGNNNTVVGFGAGTRAAMNESVVVGKGSAAVGSIAAFDGSTYFWENVIVGQHNFSAYHVTNWVKRTVAIGNYIAAYGDTNRTPVSYENTIFIGTEVAYSNYGNLLDCIGIGTRVFSEVGNDADMDDVIAIGRRAGGSFGSGQGQNAIFIGATAGQYAANKSNVVYLGNSSITHIYAQVTSITSLSDVRDKTNVEDLDHGLSFVNSLRPVKFEWNMRDEGKVGVKDMGFIAQEVIEAEDAIDDHETLMLSDRSDDERLAVSAGRLIPVLVKAIQELSTRLDQIEASV